MSDREVKGYGLSIIFGRRYLLRDSLLPLFWADRYVGMTVERSDVWPGGGSIGVDPSFFGLAVYALGAETSWSLIARRERTI